MTMLAEPEPRDQWLCAFSLHRNTRLLTAAPGGLACLHGVRALSVLWIIILHSSLMLRQHSVNEEETSESVSGQRYFVVAAGHLAVDSFFVLSGLLLVYTSAGKTESLSLSNLPRFYLNRYVRLFPLLAAAVLLRAAEPRLTDGPTAVDRAQQVVHCREYWWSALLHVQNIVNPREMCLGHSWYLSVDMQLHVAAALLLCVCGAGRARGRTWGALGAAAATLAFCFYFNFPDVTKDSPRNWGSSAAFYWTWYYYNTIVRSPPFFIGMLFGYGMHVLKNEKLHLSKWSIWLYHGGALVLSLLVILAEHPGTRASFDDHLPALNLKLALARSCWALALGWLIFACTQGYGGPVDWFLSLRLWRFVARVSYAMYLFSNILQEEPDATGGVNYFNMRTLLWRFFGDTMAAVAVSVAAIVLVETPLHTLLAPLLKPRTTHKS
ncbi:O-acyltransferase like protein-like [Cydia fagiglandana]|uniref:O-acyltransferase like protein-like n=1 Tax=Cydia fagiglandana TaxID=1458189 RepID=UPI002FEE1A55